MLAEDSMVALAAQVRFQFVNLADFSFNSGNYLVARDLEAIEYLSFLVMY